MLRSHIDIASRQRIAGWAWESDKPDAAVSVIISANDQIVARVLANHYRADLERASIGDGRFSFDVRLQNPFPPLVPVDVSVRREGDGLHLHGSPFTLEPPTAFDDTMQAAIASVLSAFGDDADLARRLAFLADQADKLRQFHAEHVSGMAGQEARRKAAWQEPGIVLDTSSLTTFEERRPRALVIDDHVPVKDRDAGSNAILSHMRSLRRIGFDVCFVPPNLRCDPALLAAEGIGCCCHPWYSSIEEVLKRQADSIALVYLHRGTMAGRYAALVRHYQPRARIVYSVADLGFLRLARQADVEKHPDLRALSKQMQTVELTAAWYADAVITHSTFEAKLLQRHVAPQKIHVVPWSIPPRPVKTPFSERRGIAFIGGYGHKPNVDAARWLVEHVMPEVERSEATIPCLLAGSDMPEVIRRLARTGVEPVGHVADLTDIFERVRLTVAPLAYGAGIKGKVLDSLAAGIPCVCTPAAAEGLDLPHILRDQVASTPAELAAKIRHLHDDDALNERCAKAGIAFIETFASEANVDALLRKATLSKAAR